MSLFPNPIQDSFDLYTNNVDASSGPVPVWESSDHWELGEGRFSGSRSLVASSNSATLLTRATGSNDASVIVNCAFIQTAALTGNDLGLGIQGLDGTTAQWTIVFRSDGAVLLKSGGVSGTTLATLTGVFTQNTWWQFQIEIITDNASGSISIWKLGQSGALTSPDHSLSSLNSRGGTANNYVNRIAIISGANATSLDQRIDDFYAFNESGSAPNDLQGDVRAEIQRPNSDSSVQFSPVGENVSFGAWPDQSPSGGNWPYVAGTTVFAPMQNAPASGILDHMSFVPSASDGSVKSKMALYADSLTGNNPSLPGELIAICNVEITGLTGPQDYDFTGQNIQIVAGTKYWSAIILDTNETTGLFYPEQNTNQSNGTRTARLSGTYPNFPTSGNTADISHLTGAPSSQGMVVFLSASSTNYGAVDDAQEDGDFSFVEDNVVGHVDQYGIQAMATSPEAIVMVVPKMFVKKTDAGSREGEIEIVSGITTHDSTSVPLTSTYGYISDPLTEDPDTSSPWTETGVNSLTIGPKVSA
jgi:hypothetical protein